MPDSVAGRRPSYAQVFRARGHDVALVRETLGRAAPDQLITLTAAREGLHVVTLDEDFSRFRQQVHRARQQPFAVGSGLIHFALKETRASSRLIEELDVIELYAARAERGGQFPRVLLREASIEFVMEGGGVKRP